MAAGAASLSCAAAVSASDEPTVTSAGSAEMPSTVGQMLSTPFTSTEPVCAGSLHVRWTDTAVVMCAATAKLAEPTQRVLPSAAVPLSVIEKPLPAGRPPMVAATVVLWLVSIVPARAKPFGPVIAYETAFNVAPDASRSESPIEPTSWSDTDPESASAPDPEPVEHPQLSVAAVPRTNKADA